MIQKDFVHLTDYLQTNYAYSIFNKMVLAPATVLVCLYTIKARNRQE